MIHATTGSRTHRTTWQQRAAEHKKCAVTEVMQAVIHGDSQQEAIRKVSARYDGKRLPDGKKLHLSFSTLKRLWLSWKADPDDSVFALHYQEGQRKEMPAWQLKLLESFAIHNGYSVNELHRKLKATDPALPFSKDTLYRHLPASAQARIAKAADLKKRQNVLSEEIRKFKDQSND